MDAGSVEVSVHLGLKRLLSDARAAQNTLQQQLRDIEVTIDANVDQGKIRGAKIEFDKLDNSIDDATKSAQQFNSVIAGVTAGITGVGFNLLISTLSELPSFIADSTLEFEKFRTVLTTLLGSTQAAEKALTDLQEFANETPFTLNEVTGAFIKLKQRGIEPTNAVLTQLGDLTASQGKSLDQITEAILDATTGEFERLKEFGIQAASAGDKVTLSFKGVTREVAKTPQAIQEAITGFGKLEGVQGGMDALSKTLGGQLSTLSDSAAKTAIAFGNELLPVLTEFVTSLNGSGDGLETLARELGQDVVPILQLLINALKFTAENGEILSRVAQILLVRFLALKAVALAASIQQAAVAMGVLTLGAGGASISLGALAVAGKAAAVSLAPLLIQLAAIAVAIEGIKFAKFVNDLAAANQSIEEASNSIEASTANGIAAAERTKSAVDKLTQAKESGRALTQQEIDDAKKLTQANDLRLEQLQAELEIAKQLPTANEEQANSKANLIQQTKTTIGALTRQNDALKGLTATTAAATATTTEAASAQEEIANRYDAGTRAIEQSYQERQIAIASAIASSNATEEEGRQQNLAAEKAYLDQRVALNTAKLQELKEAQSATTDPEQLKSIQAEILATETAIQGDRLSIAQAGAEARIQADKQAADKAKEAEEKAAEEREKVLDGVVKANERAAQAIEQSQNDRIAAVRQAQLQGAIGEEEAASQIARIQAKSVSDSINQKQREIASVRQLRAQGILSAEEAADREAQLSQEIGQANLERIEAEIAAQQRLKDEALKAVEAQNQRAEARIDSSQTQRTTNVLNAQLDGTLSEEQAASVITKIQAAATAERIAQKEQEVQEIRKLVDQGLLGVEEAADKETGLINEIGDLRQQQVQQAIKAEEQAQQKRIDAIDEELKLRQQAAQTQQGYLKLASDALSRQNALLSAQSSLISAQGSLYQQRLQFALDAANADGNSVKAEQLRRDAIQGQIKQREAQFKIEQAQLNLKFQQNQLELNSEKINARIALLEAAAQFRTALINGASKAELDNLRQIVQLRGDQLETLDAQSATLARSQQLEQQTLDAQQQTDLEGLREQQRREERTNSAITEADASGYRAPGALSGNFNASPASSQSLQSRFNAGDFLRTAIPADSALRDSGLAAGAGNNTALATAFSTGNQQVVDRLDKLQGAILQLANSPRQLSVSSPDPIANMGQILQTVSAQKMKGAKL